MIGCQRLEVAQIWRLAPLTFVRFDVCYRWCLSDFTSVAGDLCHHWRLPSLTQWRNCKATGYRNWGRLVAFIHPVTIRLVNLFSMAESVLWSLTFNLCILEHIVLSGVIDKMAKLFDFFSPYLKTRYNRPYCTVPLIFLTRKQLRVATNFQYGPHTPSIIIGLLVLWFRGFQANYLISL